MDLQTFLACGVVGTLGGLAMRPAICPALAPWLLEPAQARCWDAVSGSTCGAPVVCGAGAPPVPQPKFSPEQ
jgi:hypothetical protein